MIGRALSFVLLLLLPMNFSYPLFARVAAADGALDGRVRLAEPRRR